MKLLDLNKREVSNMIYIEYIKGDDDSKEMVKTIENIDRICMSIFYNYEHNHFYTDVLIKMKDYKRLTKIVISFAEYLSEVRPNYSNKEANNVANFINFIPLQLSYKFIERIDKYSKGSEEFFYIGVLHNDMMDNLPQWKQFYNKMLIYCERIDDVNRTKTKRKNQSRDEFNRRKRRMLR